ncbi:uncharacterized protein [Manis javanica]|uniref:uncharacterized protein n=1 Tax=Manis javanica TaxID=9974 RepID=UPI003C6D5629
MPPGNRWMGQKLASWTRAQDLHVTQENPPQILYNQVCTKNQGLCVPSNPLLSACYPTGPQREEPRPPGRGLGKEAGSRQPRLLRSGIRVLSRRFLGVFPLHGGSESGPFLRACSRPPLWPLVRVSVPGPAPAREPWTPSGGRGGPVAAASGAAVPGLVQLALGILPALLFAALFAFACLQPRRLLLHRERRLSYQSLCLFPCLLWAALRTALCAAALARRLSAPAPAALSPTLLAPLAALLLPLRSPVLHAVSSTSTWRRGSGNIKAGLEHLASLDISFIPMARRGTSGMNAATTAASPGSLMTTTNRKIHTCECEHGKKNDHQSEEQIMTLRGYM